MNLFFAHYRSAIMKELLNSDSYTYTLCSDVRDVSDSGIQVWIPEQTERFRRLPTYRVFGRFYIQLGVIALALNRSAKAIIYPGDAQHLATWFSAAIARLVGKRVLFWTHGWYQDEHGPKEFIRATFYHLASGLLLYGERAKAVGLRKGFAADKLYVIYNSLDTVSQKAVYERLNLTDIATTRKQLFQQPHLPVAICTGRLIKRRGVDMLLRAVSILKTRGHNLNVVIVGDGPERQVLEQLAKELEVSAAFIGECYDEEKLCRLFVSANVTVSPGVIGLTVMHSLAYGTPVITHDCLHDQGPEVEAINPGVNGDFFHHGDIHDLADVLALWTETEFVESQVRVRCRQTIDGYYNAEYQRCMIERAIAGLPAN